MGRISSLSERILIKLVEDGQWEIDSEGRIWRTKMRHGLKSGNSQLVNVARRRVEHRLPQGYLQVRAMINGAGTAGFSRQRKRRLSTSRGLLKVR